MCAYKYGLVERKYVDTINEVKQQHTTYMYIYWYDEFMYVFIISFSHFFQG